LALNSCCYISRVLSRNTSESKVIQRTGAQAISAWQVPVASDVLGLFGLMQIDFVVVEEFERRLPYYVRCLYS
jgi:hypothetical protein